MRVSRHCHTHLTMSMSMPASAEAIAAGRAAAGVVEKDGLIWQSLRHYRWTQTREEIRIVVPGEFDCMHETSHASLSPPPRCPPPPTPPPLPILLVPLHTRGKMVRVRFAVKRLQVSVPDHENLINDELFAAVKSGESLWTLGA
jgi:CS domain